MIRRPPRSTLFPTRRSSDLVHPQLRKAGWKGYWIDAAGALRMKDHAVIILDPVNIDRKSTRLNSSHGYISYAVFCLKKKRTTQTMRYSCMYARQVVIISNAL